MSGQAVHRSNITSITAALPCVVTTELAHEFYTGQQVRLTDLNSCMPVLRGVDQLNNQRFEIVVTGATTFFLRDPITHEDIDSRTFPPYVTGGYCTLLEQEFIYNGDDNG